MFYRRNMQPRNSTLSISCLRTRKRILRLRGRRQPRLKRVVFTLLQLHSCDRTLNLTIWCEFRVVSRDRPDWEKGKNMAARTALSDPRETAIALLTPALADPVPRVLFGTAAVSGFFKGQTAAVKAAAEYSLAQRWLEETGERVGKGAKAKSLYRLTPQGVEALLRNSPPLLALQSVEETFRTQQQLLLQVQATMQRLCDPAQQQRLEQIVRSAVEKLSPPDLETCFQGSREQKAAPCEVSGQWQEEVTGRARHASAAHPLSLPELFRELKRKWPQLELGSFHDGIRALRDAKRIRLLPYTRAYAEIAGHREAMFLDGEVMYYVRCD